MWIYCKSDNTKLGGMLALREITLLKLTLKTDVSGSKGIFSSCHKCLGYRFMSEYCTEENSLFCLFCLGGAETTTANLLQ